ncbi:hypothetical protein [Oceanicella actignis]|uniref:Uncharacterized protein n=1 Tax=Oceanicella actignis TaxID=1189325 RepID=A0A1M7TMN7_9RHOB|nr:hypothetical protein [Oceanicella actignis]TYO84643.1 hypothetical protein LY05_02908 [Oceanicella actignis]SET71426.1 hypothetical protein SAMN04488119_1085 [Oceanicella actignis]SHN71970.1 hypothetical protein SAMN05216200_1085 [Oceanicella actignis]
MLIEFIAIVTAGLGAAGVVMALRRALGLPGWATPAAAGLAMIGAQIWWDYDWRARALAALPPGAVVLSEVREGRWWKPWTLLAPPVARIVAVDAAGARTRPDAPGLKLAQGYLMGRAMPTVALPLIVDCPGARRADLADTPFGPDGMPLDPPWRPADPSDPLMRALCAPAGG